MSELYDHILRKNPAGLSYDEAVQLFLWLYCSTDWAPKTFSKSLLTKEQLVDTFQKLSEDGLIVGTFQHGIDKIEGGHSWAGLIDALLLSQVALDPEFPQRADRYL